MKLRLESKQLKSGNIQVKFHINENVHNSWYGYLLAKPSQTVEEVVHLIQQRFDKIPSNNQILNNDLLTLKKGKVNHPIYIYKN